MHTVVELQYHCYQMDVNQNFVIISRSPLFSLLNASGQVDDNNFSDVALLMFVL